MNRDILTIDTGLALEHAKSLNSYYCIPNFDAFPEIEDGIIGAGFNDIQLVSEYAEVLSTVKYIVFGDIGYGNLADILRRSGYYVFGADSQSEKLELDRVYMHNTLSRLKIPVPEYKIAKGIKQLYNIVDNLLQHTKKVYIKINKYRGTLETTAVRSVKELEIIINQIPIFSDILLGNYITFIIEVEQKGLEVGVDAFFNGRRFLSPVFETFEVSGIGNLTAVVPLEQSIWYSTLKKLSKILAINNYRGIIGLEGFYNNDPNDIKIIDVTARFPYICSYAYCHGIINYKDVITAVARGDDIDILPVNRASIQIGVNTEIKKYRYIDWPYKNKKQDYTLTNTKYTLALRDVFKLKNDIIAIPSDDTIVTVVAWRKDWNSCIDAIVDALNEIDITDYSTEPDISVTKDILSDLYDNEEFIPSTFKSVL